MAARIQLDIAILALLSISDTHYGLVFPHPSRPSRSRTPPRSTLSPSVLASATRWLPSPGDSRPADRPTVIHQAVGMDHLPGSHQPPVSANLLFSAHVSIIASVSISSSKYITPHPTNAMLLVYIRRPATSTPRGTRAPRRRLYKNVKLGEGQAVCSRLWAASATDHEFPSAGRGSARAMVLDTPVTALRISISRCRYPLLRRAVHPLGLVDDVIHCLHLFSFFCDDHDRFSD